MDFGRQLVAAISARLRAHSNSRRLSRFEGNGLGDYGERKTQGRNFLMNPMGNRGAWRIKQKPVFISPMTLYSTATRCVRRWHIFLIVWYSLFFSPPSGTRNAGPTRRSSRTVARSPASVTSILYIDRACLYRILQHEWLLSLQMECLEWSRKSATGLSLSRDLLPDYLDAAAEIWTMNVSMFTHTRSFTISQVLEKKQASRTREKCRGEYERKETERRGC